MRTKYIRGTRRQILAGILAFACFFVSVLPFFAVTSIDSRAASFTGRNIWSGGAEQLFGHSRNYLYRWTDGYQMTFCISPGKHMGVSVVSGAIRTTVNDTDIPYIGSTGDYKLLADICTWYDHHGSIYADNATYAAAQTAVWAIMNGGWESAEDLERIVDRHVAGTLARWNELLAYINGTDGGQTGMPEWLKTSELDAKEKPQFMKQENGVWRAELDISSVPQLAAGEWKFEGGAEGWSRQVSGGKLVFTYTGSQPSEMVVSVPVPDSLLGWAHNTETLNIYLPQSNAAQTQAMISAAPYEPKFYVCFSGKTREPKGTDIEIQIYEHRETFTAHYQIGLEKICAETGQSLAGAGFRVLEAFDADQLGAALNAGNMTPRPALWENYKICGDAVTDDGGHLIHRDTKNYEYAKTYCGGHPEPEYPTVEKLFPDLKEGDEGYAEMAEAVEELAAALKQKWQSLAEQCVAYNEGNHFHSMTPGEAKEEMLADRDAVYRKFIGLEYKYAFQETQARYGYVRHGQHKDDLPLPVYRVKSLEAGGETAAAANEYSKDVIVNEDAGYGGSRMERGGEDREDTVSVSSVGADLPIPGISERVLPGMLNRWMSAVSGRRITKAVLTSGGRATTESMAGAKKPAGAETNAALAATPADAETDAATPADAGANTAFVASPSVADCLEPLRYWFISRPMLRLADPEAGEPVEEAALPEPVEDDVEWLTPRSYDATPEYSVKAADHRTEGELHINKRDMELAVGESDIYDSYGDSQGDATLEGAVYGLYAAEDIIHPDGKTGVVYRAGELTAVAATDKNGDASFMAYTEEGDISRLKPEAFPDGRSGSEPLRSWIGRPLIAGRYLVKEIARSEGYELTVDPAAEEKVRTVGRADVTSAMSHPIDMHDGSWLEFEVTCENTSEGFEILVSGFPEGSSFYRSRMEENSAEEEVIVGVKMVPTGEYERAGAGEYRLDSTGSYIPQRDAEGNILYDRNDPVMRTYFVTRRISCYPGGEYKITVDPAKWADAGEADGDYICRETNAILKQLGYTALGGKSLSEAPWTAIPLTGRTNQELTEALLEWFEMNSFWSSALVERVWEENGEWRALVYHDYPGGSAVYDAAADALYIKIPVRVEGGGERHMYVPFDAGTYTMKNGYATLASLKQKEGEIPFGAVMEDYLETEYRPLYERYEEGELRLDGRGEPIPVYREEYIRETSINTTSDYALTPLDAVYDAAGGSYRIYVENTVDWNREDGPVVMTFRAAAPYTSYVHDGKEMFYSDYLTEIAGAGASAFACVRGDEPEGLAELVYPGQISPMQDGAGSPGSGSRTTPVGMQEKIIGQRVKVIKTIRAEEGTPDDAPEQELLPNFRFKAYLKSNLERIYRNQEGEIVWLDRRGRQIDIAEAKNAYPALVPAVFTKVPRSTEVLYKQTEDAVNANEALYPEGEDEPSGGYTAVLETVERQSADGAGVRTVKVPNYDKFFDALTVANYDKWDNGAEKRTSFRPFSNAANRSKEAEENAGFSDMVRQFAIDWYLDGEVSQMDEREKTAYGDQFYDEALRRALRKAEDYLKPFFNYDLDEIYAVKWDGAAGGGPDGDPATVNADEEGEAYYYGISAGLPYGTYVIAEQQPHYADLQDYRNRHYRIDSPKEVLVPSVYMQTESEASDDTMSAEYIYDSGMPLDDMQERYGIRFGEETCRTAGGTAAPYVTEAHNHSGDFELYKYGLDIDVISNGAEKAGEGDYFALTQDEWKPYLNYYNDEDDRTEKVTYYLAEGKSGREEIGQVYRYSSVTEDAAEADGVRFAGGTAAEENPEGYYYRDGVRAMRGMKTAYEGLFSPMLVPWSLVNEETTPGMDAVGEGGDAGISGAGTFGRGSTENGGTGPAADRSIVGDGSYARVRFVNRPYSAKLRIEKMDSETRENLLHDDAIFNIYEAERDDSPDGEGTVRFYDRDTVVYGSMEFLESMGASGIRPWLAGKYRGTVPAGTPVCHEETRVFQTDASGARVGQFHSYTTARDGIMESAGESFAGGYGQQNAGWLETPEPLAAGVYVLAEVKAPAGYVRSRPIAVEIYSDTVTYYQRGSGDSRVAATLYDSADDPKDPADTARIYVENAPTRLLVEKRKEASADSDSSQPRTVTYKISGRVDGSLAEIGGRAEYEYAFQNGVYMGYAWRKGTLEYLNALRDTGMDIRIVYHGGLFAGYGYVTQALETADDENGYVTGALMTLYEGLELTPSGDREDLAYDGLVVERGRTGSVTRMYVKKGSAGFRTEFVNTGGGAGSAGTPQDIWKADKVERGDTDILFYDLSGLELFRTETVAGRKVLYAYGRDHDRLEVNQLEEDKELSPAADGSQSIFAFRDGTAVFELAGGDFTKISYSAADKVFEGEFARPAKQADGSVRMSGGVVLYHLDADGSRDGLADPYTGMAYALADAGEAVRVLVWPVNIARDGAGRLLAQEKISTSRIATLGESADAEYLTGTWKPDDGEQSHEMHALAQNRAGQDLNGESVITGNNGSFQKSVEPIYDEHGLPLYYRYSGESYETEIPLYDRNGRLVREKTSDLTGDYDEASYVMAENYVTAENGNAGTILHRAGESYILENTWVTGEITPDDPFSDRMTEGQADLLRRVPAGTYIMEELAAPEGYLKGLPIGVVAEETTEVQKTGMTDATTKLLIGKADGTPDYTYRVLDMRQTDASGRPAVLGTVTEGKGSFGQTQVSGARLALYEASRVYTSDLEQYPDGTYLKKKGVEPLRYRSTNSRTGAEELLTASWVTGEEPLYLEGIPAGEYLLEETETPPGMVSASAMEIEAAGTGQVQTYILYNDHTKVEIEKYTGDGSSRELVNGAGFTVYEAVTDAQGKAVYDENGWPVYDPQKEVDHFVSSDGKKYAGFIREFEDQFGRYGTSIRSISWEYDGQSYTANYVNHTQIDAAADGGSTGTFPTTVQMTLRTEDGADIMVTAYGQGESRLGRNWVYEYQLDRHVLTEVNERAASYLTEDGMRRWDYLPAGASFVVVETEPPAGYAAAEPLFLKVQDMADIQRYRIRNEEGAIMISKTFAGGGKELPGARLALYCAAPDGGLIQEEAYLAAEWTSGRDGIYTETDRINGRIPQGYEVGDRKPHTLRRLPEGDYWLVEIESPDYYTTFRPVKIEYHTDDPIRVVRVSDVPAEGRVTVKKTDPEGEALTGAVFEVSAYRQPDLTEPVFTRSFSDTGGTAVLSGLPVGEVQEDGSIIPYCYRLRETIPPEGYAADPQIYSFEFSPDRNGVSFSLGESAEYERQIINRKTRIAIRKKDFGEAYVNGAELAVYLVTGTDENGVYLCDEKEPVERWITSEAEPDRVLEGLIAGRSYLLAETSVPEGYQIMPPAVFTLSMDGRRISSISSRTALITLHDLFAATIRGRYAVRSEITVTDSDGNETVSWTASGDGHVVTSADGIRDGEVYTLTERTIYSDGSSEVTDRQTKRLCLPDGSCLVPDRRPARVHLSLREIGEELQDGRSEISGELASYDPAEEQPELTVGDPSSEKEIFSNRKTYVLEETTFYGDGSWIESGKMAFEIGDDGSIAAIAGYDRKQRVTVSKQDITGDRELPGAQLQIADGEGNVIEEWISGQRPHFTEADLKPGQTYTLRETLPPKGYAYASEIRFTVPEDGSMERVVMVDAPTRVSVSKTDITGEKELPGAKLQILEYAEAEEDRPQEDQLQENQPKTRLVEEWISDGEPHEIVGKLEAGKTYVLHEEAAPAGYAYAADIEFTVSLDGVTDRIVMKDEAVYERPRKPREPEEPEEPKKPEPGIPGTVEAEYQVYVIDSGNIPLGSMEYYNAPETGDRNNKAVIAALFLMAFSVSACLILGKRMRDGSGRMPADEYRPDAERAGRDMPRSSRSRRSALRIGRRRRTWRRTGSKILPGAAIVIAVAAVLAAAAITVYAEERVTETSETEITVQYEIFPALENPGQDMALPPDTYVWQENEYRLRSYQLVAVPMQEIVKYVRKSVRYEGVEKAAAIPETIEAEILDEDTGRSALVMLPLEKTEASGWRWEEGFSFPVTVRGYDSGSFILGDETVDVRENQPFAGYEDRLLVLAGVDPAYYRIDSAEWSGPPQTDEDGLVCRRAAASGRKYVADIEAVYGGRAVIPKQPGMTYEAVYERIPPETEAESASEAIPEPSESYVEVTAAPAPAAAAQEETQQVPEGSGVLRWLRNIRHVTTIVIGLGILFVPLLLLIVRRRSRRGKKDENRRKV